MEKDPYLILGLSHGATEQEVDEAYRSLRAEYSKKRFEEGEVGLNASKMVGVLDQAYADCIEDISKNTSVAQYGNVYGKVEELIVNKKFSDAQNQLDNVAVRDAEWHYMQARIYYNQGLLDDCKSQLQMALDLEPGNSKYTDTLNKLNQKLQGNTQQNTTSNNTNNANSAAKDNTNFEKENSNNNSRAGYTKPNNKTARNNGNDEACCNTCSTLLCMDCCCECMGGDLIPCC